MARARKGAVTRRDVDIVVYGATGFVGSRAAQYLARSEDAVELSLAIAGRDAAKLEAVRARLGRNDVQVIVADSGDVAAVEAMAARARVVLNTAGPFAKYGDHVVDACVRARTHYVDITGETLWVRSLIDRHHAQAEAQGTRIIPCCGFDSVPSDLGTLLAVRRLQRRGSGECEGVKSYFQMLGGLNGGTLASGLVQAEADREGRARDPFLLDPHPHSAEEQAQARDPLGIHYDADVNAWVGPFLMGFVNTRVVRRSAALFAQWDEGYGEHFRYQEYSRFGGALGLPAAIAVTGGLAVMDMTMSTEPGRRLLGRMLPQPGSGPSERLMDRGWFKSETLAKASNGRRVRVRISHRGDPGNRATVRFVCEAALAIAVEGEALPGGPTRGGVLTPATGLGQVLADRLPLAGFEIALGEA
jgi:short subunit dehydrogenase-like uncharacterized protein